MTAAARYFINAFGYSDTGLVRDANEDAFVVADLSEEIRVERTGGLRFPSGARGAMFAVADGMGGAAAGELASHLGLRTLYREVQEQVREVRQPDEEFLEQVLIESVGAANRRIFDLSNSRSDLTGMGTTLTAALEVGDRLVIGQIGDSRAYLLRDGGIRQLTRDQSLVGARVSSGEITAEQARNHPQRNVLLQALGIEAEVELALNIVSLHACDILLLCSDGLHSQMAAKEIFEAVVNSTGPQAACEELIALANNRGGPDNITAVLAQFLVK
jgi:protein phosphatase